MGYWGREFTSWRWISVILFAADKEAYPWIDRDPRDEGSA